MRHSDPEGLYRALGVSPAADQDEIKNAYRRLAKETHPDTSQQTSAFQFHRVYNAYKVLSDRRARARYDRRFGRQNEDHSWSAIKPVCCLHCGKVTAQPRQLSFERIFSIFVVSLKRPVSGIYCFRCAQSQAVKSSLLTAIFGWWALPVAPFLTLRAIARNTFGGKRDSDAEQRLLWQNSRAFAALGNRKLSYALARKLTGASDPDIALGARELVQDMEARGANSKKIKLKDPWRIKPLSAMTHLTLAAILPVGIGGVVLQGMKPDDVVQVETRSIGTIVPAVQIESSDISVLEERRTKVPLCWKVPQNGQVLYRINPGVTPGHDIALINDTPEQAIVKIRSAFSKRLIAAMYMSANASAKLQGIPDGYYVVQYAFGSKLAAGCITFVDTEAAWQFPDIENLRTIATGEEPQHLNYELSVAPSEAMAGAVKPYAFNLN